MVSNSVKTANGDEAVNPNNLINTAIKTIKDLDMNIGIIADVALDPYTTHGHDGIFIKNEVDNDTTIDILAEMALIQAQSGADIIAPSDMQDGRIEKIRLTLEKNHYKNTLILSYAAKYASHFYAPFRDAVGSSNNLAKKDKKSYQQDFANSNEALHEVMLDINEGSDFVMIKPAMSYLDIIYLVSTQCKLPVFGYQVSGEFAMLNFLANDSHTALCEILYESTLSIKRAGANCIVTYGACILAEYIIQNN